MNPLRSAALSLSILFSLAACAAPLSPVAPFTVTIAPGVSLALPKDGELARSVDVMQLVTARHDGNTFLLSSRLSAGPQGIALIGTDSLGRRAMTVNWRNGELTSKRADWLPAEFPPENVLADIVLVYWPPDAIARNLTNAVLDVEPQGRRIHRHGEDIVVIRYQGDPWTGTATLSNLAWGYEIEIRSAKAVP